MGPSLAVFFLGLRVSLHALEIVEKENIFEQTPCPAFLLFDNTAFLADMSFELPCHCKPEEVSAVVWYFQEQLGSLHTKVLTDFDGRVATDARLVRAGSDMLTRFSIRLFSLVVFRARPGDSGLYLCGTRSGDYFYGYDVDVQSSRGLAVAFSDRGQQPRGDEVRGPLRLFTAFWEWTRCDRCGVPGEQWRLGLCYLQGSGLSARYRQSLPDVVSCGSRAVPRELRATAHGWPPELAIRSCRVPCPQKPHRRSRPQLADVLAKLGSRPWVPEVPVQFHRQRLGHGLILTCPGARPEHAVAWDKGGLPLYLTRFLVGVNRSMRIFIDHGHQLHIRFARLDDRGLYRCWLQGIPVAGFRLAVVSGGRYRASLSDPDTRYALQAALLCYLLITAVFILIHLCRCCCSYCSCALWQ
ncbi:Ig-like V-type domain-containing protein FAM187A [Tachyglossus aculeatus]|uniref:Ig-like V-type domain-containing protein FAM187A n=1 Tax=Tachyglossus aculeatus TaxID=9261 RepID=UPI0018F40F8B|nr:Ig-like V-type domain-containing protein FAM187A [Tachyglossus aculeatus]